MARKSLICKIVIVFFCSPLSRCPKGWRLSFWDREAGDSGNSGKTRETGESERPERTDIPESTGKRRTERQGKRNCNEHPCGKNATEMHNTSAELMPELNSGEMEETDAGWLSAKNKENNNGESIVRVLRYIVYVTYIFRICIVYVTYIYRVCIVPYSRLDTDACGVKNGSPKGYW